MKAGISIIKKKSHVSFLFPSLSVPSGLHYLPFAPLSPSLFFFFSLSRSNNDSNKKSITYLWWFEGVIGREVDRQEEDTTLVRTVFLLVHLNTKESTT